MKIHLTWIRVTVAAATIAAAGGEQAAGQGQYAPYAPASPYSTVAPYGVQQAQPPVYPSTSYSSAIQGGYTPTQPSSIPASQDRYAPAAQAYQAPTAYQPPQYQAPVGQPSYPQIARRMTDAATAGTSSAATLQSESMPMPDSATSGGVMQGYNATAPYPMADGYSSGNPTSASDTCGDQDYGLGGYMNECDGGSQWFGGIYGLLMTRDNPDYRRFAVQVDPTAYPYYPPANTTVLALPNADHDYRGGFEIRFGSTFSTGGGRDNQCDPYGGGYGNGYGYGGCNNCEIQDHAWELGYWFLDGDINSAQAFDTIPTDTNRIYGAKNFAGLQYNGRPVNDFYDYQMPVTDPALPGANDARVLAQRIRTNFQAQNLEFNLYRLPLYGVSTCGYGECAPECGSPFSITALCGFRYLRIDDDFEYATMWGIDNGAGVVTPPAFTPWDGLDNELYYDINVDNHLTGFQLGGNMNYCVSCKCNLFWNTNFGIYNNHMSVRQRVYGELGPAIWAGSGEDATFRSNKEDVAFVGEMLIGGTYAFNCHWRGILAYRAVAINGVALSVDQMPEDFANEAQVALVDSDGSLVIHGGQVGLEYFY